MAGKKAPALTSPWKVGFLVSLLLVAMAIGVGFFITRAFGLQWTWVHFGGTSWRNWTFDMDAFIKEMATLVILVPVLSMVSYFMVTSAVRKYRAYLDSGLDYKRLVAAISQIDDLDDKNNIKKLGNYPELKAFLMNLRDRVIEREAACAALEKSLDVRVDKAASEALSADVETLVDAITGGNTGGLKEDLTLSTAELKRVEQAIRLRLADAPLAGSPAPLKVDHSEELQHVQQEMQTIRHEIEDTAAMLDSDITDVCADVEASRDTAGEIAGALQELTSGLDKAAAGAGDGARVTAALASLDTVAHSLSALGEAAKGVAINTALQAAQQETVDAQQLVKLAEDVKIIAARFSSVASDWSVASVAAREAFAAGGPVSSGALATANASAVEERVAAWLDQSSALVEKLRALQAQQAEMLSDVAARIDGPSDPSYQELNFEVGSPGDSRSETPEQASPATDVPTSDLPDIPDVPTVPPVADPPAAENDDNMFLSPVDDTRPTTSEPKVKPGALDGLEKHGDIFDAPPAQPVSPAPAAPPAEPVAPVAEAPAEDPGAGETVAQEDYFTDVPESASRIVPAHGPVDTPRAATPAAEDEGFVVGPSIGAATASPATAGEMDPASEQLTDVAEVDLDEDADAVDLYALGAVDYEPDSVHHNV